MPKWIGVAEFARRLAKYEQINYKKLLRYAESGVLPVMQRYGCERYRIKCNRKVLQFLVGRGLEQNEIAEILQGWHSV